MRKSIVILCLLFTFFQYESIAQIYVPSDAKVVNVKFNISQDKVIIKYDIINAKRSNLFDITVKAFNNKGEEIVMYNVKGNLKSVSPGVMKTIVWYAGEDLKAIEDNFNIKVHASLINPKLKKTELKALELKALELKALELKITKIKTPITKWEASIYSTLYPGFGTYKLTGGKIHLAKGVVSYGLISVSIIIGSKSRNYYDDYLGSTNMDERNELYDKSISGKKMANICAISAATVWLLEYVNIYLAKNNLFKNDVQLGMWIDQFSNLPMVSINFKL